MTTHAANRPIAGHDSPPSGLRPFGIVDELNCYFDSPAEPNNVHMEVWLPGHLSPERLRAAVMAMLAGLPRARARRAAGAWWRPGYAWEFPPEADVDPVSVTDWRTEADLHSARTRFLATAPALDRSPPFRLLLARGPGWDSLILNAHHAAFDGRSCLRLLRLVADRYGGRQPPEAPAADHASLARSRSAHPGRPQPPQKQPSPNQPLGKQPAEKRAAGNWFAPNRLRVPVWRTARIASQHAHGRPPRRAPGYGLCLLGWPGVPAVPEPQNESRVTVNDLLIATLIQTIVRWNATRHRRPGRVRISMPVDARPPGHGDELGNLSRLCTVTADPFGTTDLTAGVAEQTRQAKSQPGPQVGPAQAAVARSQLPAPVKRGLLRLALRWLGRLGCDTSLLSNLGNVTDPPSFGMLSPTRMWFSTSGHMPRGLSVGAITVDGRLHLCFRYRYALLDDAAAHAFVTEYAAALSALTEAGTADEHHGLRRNPAGAADDVGLQHRADP